MPNVTDSSPATARARGRLVEYARLMRLDRPIGIWLLLWPCLWALWISAAGRPDERVFVIFLIGTLGAVITYVFDLFNGVPWLSKEGRESPKKIDLAVCAIGARMARRMLLASPAWAKHNAGPKKRPGRVVAWG